eukprot:1150783-Pelagomonas_calceolata.AAC.1
MLDENVSPAAHQTVSCFEQSEQLSRPSSLTTWLKLKGKESTPGVIHLQKLPVAFQIQRN